MAIDLAEIEKNAEKIKSASDEKSDIMHDIATNFHGYVHGFISYPEALLDYIDRKDLKALCDDAQHGLTEIKNAVEKGINPYLGSDNDIQNPIINLGLTCACLHERLMRDCKKIEASRKDLKDLENAKPIFAMLKNEVKLYTWGKYFDEYTISQYIQEMLELAEKHKVDLGIDVSEDTEEVPTTYATELEALEETEETA